MKQTMRILETSIFEVFEKMFFLYLEQAGRGDMRPWLKASIEFRGERSGAIDIFFSRAFLTSMARNMLSLTDDEVGDGEREDCAREAANMVCGNFLATLDGSRRYDLTIPVCSAEETVAGNSGEAPGRLDYNTDSTTWGMTVVLSGCLAVPEAP